MSKPQVPAVPRPLTPQQDLFCAKYVELGGNGTEAAKAAGYSEKTATVAASKLLRDPRIKARVAELTARVVEAVNPVNPEGKENGPEGCPSGPERPVPDVAQEVEASVQAAAGNLQQAQAAQLEAEGLVARLRQRIIDEVAAMGFARMGDIATWTEDEISFVPSAELTPEAMASVGQVTAKIAEVITDEGDKILRKTTLSIKQHPKLASLKTLMKLIEPPKAPSGGNGDSARPGGIQAVVFIAGGPMGLELAASDGAGQVAAIAVMAADEVVPAAAAPSPATGLREWSPGPKRKLSDVAAAARAALAKAK